MMLTGRAKQMNKHSASRISPVSDLPEIPVIQLDERGVVGLAEREATRLNALIQGARRQYTPPVLYATDHLAHRWFARAGNPYLGEMEAIAQRLGCSGTFALNLSYEWACTGAVGPDPVGPGSRLVHSLDWIQHGIGRHPVVVRIEGQRGRWFNLTWPGFVGAMKGIAPGRFAAAINQPPVQRRLGLLPLDWFINRIAMWRSNAGPASHLLRQVFETCGSYDEAKARLGAARVCTPAIFLLTGTLPTDAVVIERLGSRAVFHDGPIAVANHWLTRSFGPGSRGIDSEGRQRLMADHLSKPASDLRWLLPPIVNRYTRLVSVANAATGELVVQGWEADGPATAVLRLRL
jgi:hypothetical protein